MNRIDRVREVLRLEGLAAAAQARAGAHRAELDREAREELAREGTAPSWRMPDIGTVALPLSNEAPVVSDMGVLLKWVEERHPGEVETVKQVRAAFQAALLKRVLCEGDLVFDPETGEAIPGMTVRPGGLPKTLTITASRDVKDVFAVHGDRLLDLLDATLAESADGAS